MDKSIVFSCNLKNLYNLSKKIVNIIHPNEIILLKGNLGSGKTTFARMLIISLYKKMKILPPNSIKSPTYPIMISYDLIKYEIYHYDLYRLKKYEELEELAIFESFLNNITIIEWPELLLQTKNLQNYILIQFDIENTNYRKIEIFNSSKIINL